MDSNRSFFQHVFEVHIPANVQLRGPFKFNAAVTHQFCQCTVNDGRAELRLNIVSNDGQACPLQTLARHSSFFAMNTGIQFTTAQPASNACATYHFVASSLPNGQIINENISFEFRAEHQLHQRLQRAIHRPSHGSIWQTHPSWLHAGQSHRSLAHLRILWCY